MRQESAYGRQLQAQRREVWLIAWTAFTLGVGLTWAATSINSWRAQRQRARFQRARAALEQLPSIQTQRLLEDLKAKYPWPAPHHVTKREAHLMGLWPPEDS